MNVTVEGTLFLVDVDAFTVTVFTWQGEEATLSISHLYAFVDHLRAANVPFPASLPSVSNSSA
jgi:hypothetical protein